MTLCVAAHCAVDVAVAVVCSVFGCCGELGLRSGKCLWLIAHCGWVVLWRDQGGRDAGLMYGLQGHSCAVLSSGAVSCWGFNGAGQVIAAACSRGSWVCARRHCAADELMSAQVGDGTSGTNRLTPVAVVGLGSGVANVALGDVRLFFMGHDSWVFCVAAHC